MQDLEERFATALHSTARSWRQVVDRRLKYLGVSQASWTTIAVAAKATQPLSQSELADRLAVEGATMVAMVDRLVKSGLVVRESCTRDRRVKYIVLTEAGYRLFDIVKTEAAKVRTELLASIQRETLESATLLLETLHAVIEANP
jgi:MarR family transcriptional regulator for hemolysin